MIKPPRSGSKPERRVRRRWERGSGHKLLSARRLCLPGMDAKNVASMTAEALNSMEERLSNDIAEVKQDVAELKHDIHRLDVKIDVNHRVIDEKMDRGFQQMETSLQQKMDRGFQQIMEHIDRR